MQYSYMAKLNESSLRKVFRVAISVQLREISNESYRKFCRTKLQKSLWRYYDLTRLYLLKKIENLHKSFLCICVQLRVTPNENYCKFCWTKLILWRKNYYDGYYDVRNLSALSLSLSKRLKTSKYKTKKSTSWFNLSTCVKRFDLFIK